MSLLTSAVSLLAGIGKRIYWLLPALLLDPFDIVEQLFNVTYEIPMLVAWGLAGGGLFVATVLTFHELRGKHEEVVALAHSVEPPKLPEDRVLAIMRELESNDRALGIARTSVQLRQAAVDVVRQTHYIRDLRGRRHDEEDVEGNQDANI